ncbi:hypothetical protein BCR44DRAFT_68270 [Catenaria anguillulae PL171]|uniref:Uncharacterized protein n=1 Tax=Catenaria anguillulae PL171 TaxID=765915 RepID=A0A1Y2I438_9FUNG|nr:hypothetical protein BCR44DRAFT_68270 [Catenaria anguillulae PL171]
MPSSPKATTSGPKSPTDASSVTPIAAAAAAAPISPTPIAPPATTSSTATATSAAFPPLPQHATNPHFQDLMARIRRAEKFGGAVSEADRTMYRQFKFGTFKAPAAKKGGSGVPKTTASPAGKSGAGASKKSGTSKSAAAAAATGLEAVVAAAGRKKGGLLDGISDEDRLARLKRAYKFGVEATPEITALETWYLGKFGEPFSLGKQ